MRWAPASPPWISREDDAYERTRRAVLWNERVPDRRPDAIVAPADEGEVVAAVRAAAERGMKVAVKSGGHSWTGAPLRDGGMLIDLGRLNGLAIDADAARVATQPAVRVRDLAAALTDAGLGFPTGHCPTVCVGGYLLAGGWGWNSHAWGPACHRVEAIDVVTAAGELVRADAHTRPELLWVARGAGPGFPGVVTRFHLRAEPLPAAIATCERVYALDRLPEVVGWLVEHAERIPRCVKHGMKLAWSQDAGAPVLSVGGAAFAASREQASTALDALEGCPLADAALSAERALDVGYAELYAETAAAYPEGHRWGADTLWTDADPVDGIARLAEHLTRAPSRRSFVTLALSSEPLPPAPAPGAALSMRGRLFVGCYGLWSAAADDAANLAWVDRLMRDVGRDAVGHYLGEMDLTRWDPSRAFAPAEWRRLGELRERLDPHGRFHDFLQSAAR